MDRNTQELSKNIFRSRFGLGSNLKKSIWVPKLDFSTKTLIWDVYKKRRALNNHEFWSDFRAEISHMRPIQARKLKLIEVSICGKLTATAAASQQLCPSGKGP